MCLEVGAPRTVYQYRSEANAQQRYGVLLAQAEGAEGGDLALASSGNDHLTTADDVRKLRPGEHDFDPENKPARPDGMSQTCYNS